MQHIAFLTSADEASIHVYKRVNDHYNSSQKRHPIANPGVTRSIPGRVMYTTVI